MKGHCSILIGAIDYFQQRIADVAYILEQGSALYRTAIFVGVGVDV